MFNDFNILNFSNLINEKCNNVQIKTFKKGQTITEYLYKYHQICILLEGSAELIRYDLNGGRTIIGNFSTNEVFGSALYPKNTNNQLEVIAKKNCTVQFFDYAALLEDCKKDHEFFEQLSFDMINLVLSSVSKLNLRIESLSNKTIREKLLSYFNLLSSQKLSKHFSIPFSYTDLADYLSIDRSALMRELKLLQDEGFIERDGSKITLLFE